MAHLWVSVIVVLAAFSILAFSQTPTKVGFFYDGTLNDGGFISSAVDGINLLKAKYPDVQIGYNGPPEGMDFLGLLIQ